MAKKSGNNKSDAELKEQIARSREDLALQLNRVREEVDLPRKIRLSVRREPVPWIVGAKGGTKSKHVLLEAGFVLGALRIAASLLKPVVMNFVEKKFGSYSERGRSGPKGF